MSYTESLYVILGVDEDASQQEIKQAYKKAALRTHPDRALPERKLEAEANFKKVAE
jgi:DnaJ-class molecular chaperone